MDASALLVNAVQILNAGRVRRVILPRLPRAMTIDLVATHRWRGAQAPGHGNGPWANARREPASSAAAAGRIFILTLMILGVGVDGSQLRVRCLGRGMFGYQ